MHMTLHMSDEEFEAIVSKALDALPEKYGANMENVLVTYADEPTEAQRHKLALRCNETLFGLYEGIPLTARGGGYNMVLPDKITIFKFPLLAASATVADLYDKVRHTLWHEVAHHFGLDHKRIHQLDDKRNVTK